MYKLQTCKQ